MAELKIKCEQPEFLKLLFQDTLRDRIGNREKGIKLTREQKNLKPNISYLRWSF
jgi:hypothetical protein